ncbi:MAG: hypothetical protein IKD15_02995 [Clostridia bacterium]|nr:hypothetical protein [Clostridia bacterium]
MDWKKIGKALLYPPTVLRIVLIPVAAAFLVLSMVFLGTKSIVAILAYVLAAYTLTVWCLKIPYLIRWFKRLKEENKYIKRWRHDARLRVNVTLYGALIWNGLYGIFQLCLGVYHRTFWFCSLGAYYICLAVMRFFLFKHTRRYAPGEKRRAELLRYRACGWIFLVMNLALALIVFFMLYWDKTFTHHMITAIMMATYTFTAFTIAIVNMVRYKKYKSPVFSASKAISLTAACVSMLTLTSTMLTTFNDGTMDAMTQKILLGAVGFSAVTVVIVLAIYMIVVGNKKLKEEVKNGK